MQEIKFTKHGEEKKEEPKAPKKKNTVVSPTRPTLQVDQGEGIIDSKEYNDETNAVTVKAYLKRGAGDFQKAFSKKTFYDFILGVDVFSIDKKVQLRAYIVTSDGNMPIAVEENEQCSVSVNKNKIKNGTITVIVELKYYLGVLKTKSYTLNLAMSI